MASDYLLAAKKTKLQSDALTSHMIAQEDIRGHNMASVNKVILVGNLGKDPELKYTGSGIAVCNFSLATTEKWTTPQGQLQEKTEWHRVTVWKKQAENCGKYLKKGSAAYVEGRLTTRSWDDQQTGQKRFSTEITAESVKFLGGARENGVATIDEPPPIPNNMSEYEQGDSLDDVPF